MKKYFNIAPARLATTSKTASSVVSFGERELLFRFSIMSITIYMDMFGKDLREAKTMIDMLNYMYSAYLAGCKYGKIEPELTPDEFYNLLDDYPLQFAELIKAFTASQRAN